MPKQSAPIEINTFVAGLVTDFTPLTFPDNASLDEDNFVLNTEGDRQRRLGMDYEDDYAFTTSVSTNLTNLAHTSFRWENAGGDSAKALLVIQFGQELSFFDLDSIPLSDGLIDTIVFSTASATTKFSYAVVDGILTVANGTADVEVFEYEASTLSIINTQVVLEVRDLFGVEDIVSGVNLHDGNNISLRPATTTDEHTYNLRNQSWATPRLDGNNETLKDPIQAYFDEDSKYPSNSDTVAIALYPDANDTDNRTVDRFFPVDLKGQTQGSTEGPKGHFVINALSRGVSRLEAITELNTRNSPVSMISITDLPTDTTPGGPSVLSEFAGRVFYAGFQGDVTDGDKKSPRMSSYILFSRLIRESSDVGRCYQMNDPTSAEETDLLQTDGGFIRLDEAYGIKAMVNVKTSLFVFAANGVWRVVGVDENGFDATGYKVVKISERGIRGASTVVEAEGSLVYWADDGIYKIDTNQFGDWSATSLTRNRISILYDNINVLVKDDAQGIYDPYDKKIRWVYNNTLSSVNDVRELVMDAELGAFYTNTIYTTEGETYPKVIGLFESNPYTVSNATDTVIIGSDVIQSGAVDVVVGTTTLSAVTRSITYITVNDITPSIQFSFSIYKDRLFRDWFSVDDVGVDAYAYMVTGYISGGEFQREKQVPLMTTYFRKTESGFTEDINGDFVPLNASSCLMQYQWEWTNSAVGNRWSRTSQVYRPRRIFLPDDVNNTYDDGHLVVTNKHKVRGAGRVMSIKFMTEPLKDCQLYGWSMIASIESNA